MNIFDAVVGAALLIAVVSGFRTGLLRSVLTILAYLVAIPVAVWAIAALPAQTGIKFAPPIVQNSILFFGIILVIGMMFGKLERMALDETIGSEVGLGDRLGGAALGAVRVGLLAVTVVIVFDKLVPAERQPVFLTGSQLRPLLSAAGQKGFQSLPPELIATIDRFKREQPVL
jgi:membrane protein required for colicin V production